MTSNIEPYIKPILTAVICFPFAAFFITLPFAIHNYRKYGGISIIKVLIFYSFILYCICAYFLTILPLPSKDLVSNSPIIPINWIPFSNFITGLRKIGMSIKEPLTILNPSLWFKYLKSSYFFQILANSIMLLPLGIYLRYYFQCDLKKIVIISFCFSLFFEITQLTGLYFIYPHDYRCPDINDLLTNTLGGYLGYLITPFLTKFLPTREQLDYISWKKGERVTIFKQLFAYIIDLLLIFFLDTLFAVITNYLKSNVLSFELNLKEIIVLPFLYFVFIQYLCNGFTLGKKILNIKVVDLLNPQKKPKIINLIKRYFIINLLIPLIVFFDCCMLAVFILSLLTDIGIIFRLIIFVLTIATAFLTLKIILKATKNDKQLPHDYYSNIQVVNTYRPNIKSL